MKSDRSTQVLHRVIGGIVRIMLAPSELLRNHALHLRKIFTFSDVGVRSVNIARLEMLQSKAVLNASPATTKIVKMAFLQLFFS